jgi:hypothetical protein
VTFTRKQRVGIRFQRNNIAELAVAADGAGITAFRGMKSLQSAPLLNLVVMPRDTIPATMTHPKFDAPALADLAAAFARRGKAIRYHGKLSVSREVEADDGTERLNIDYGSVSSLGIRLRFSAWASGDWWFLAFQSRAGRNASWLFKHELRGELAHHPADALVKSFEDSILVGYWSAGEQLTKLQEIWQVLPPPDR